MVVFNVGSVGRSRVQAFKDRTPGTPEFISIVPQRQWRCGATGLRRRGSVIGAAGRQCGHSLCDKLLRFFRDRLFCWNSAHQSLPFLSAVVLGG